jgi:AraC family transcriptional regulator
MMQTVGIPSWPRPLVSPIGNRIETWKAGIDGKHTHDANGASLNDVTILYPNAVIACSDDFGWQNIRLVHLRHDLSEILVPTSESHCLLVNLSGPLQIRTRDLSVEGEVRAGEVAVIPAGTAWSSQATAHTSNIVLLFLRPLFVRNAAAKFDLSQSELCFTPQIGLQSTHIRHIAMSLLSELQEANVVGRFYADSMASGLAMQLIRHYSSLRDVRIGRGGMAPHSLRKAIGLIDHHLREEEEGRVELRIVAQEVGISYSHFSRAFKQAMGMTATSYIAERRIERAKGLMEETDLPISEVALRAGFSSQSHFTTSFRRLVGVTPRSFRRRV